jgi:hypothetical protein
LSGAQNFIIHRDGGINRTASSLAVVPTGVWCFLSLSYRSQYFRFYINGVDFTNVSYVDSVSQDVTNGAAFHLMNRYDSDNGFGFKGYVWGFRWWSGRALAPAEHMAIFNRERHLFGV